MHKSQYLMASYIWLEAVTSFINGFSINLGNGITCSILTDSAKVIFLPLFTMNIFCRMALAFQCPILLYGNIHSGQVYQGFSQKKDVWYFSAHRVKFIPKNRILSSSPNLPMCSIISHLSLSTLSNPFFASTISQSFTRALPLVLDALHTWHQPKILIFITNSNTSTKPSASNCVFPTKQDVSQE